jgi:Calcium binding
VAKHARSIYLTGGTFAERTTFASNPTRRGAGEKKPHATKISDAELDKLIEEATVDAYDESEQIVGFQTMLEEHLAMPFETEVLGVKVTVEAVDLSDDDQIVAVCTRGKSRQRIPILDLP